MKYLAWNIFVILFLQVKCTPNVPLPFVRDLISNITNANNIFNTLFDLGSIHDLKETLEPMPTTKLGPVVLNNTRIIVKTNGSEDQELNYFNMFGQQEDEESSENYFEYNRNDYGEIKLQLKPKLFKITGVFTLRPVSSTQETVRQSFVTVLKNPVFKLTNVTTAGAMNFITEPTYQYTALTKLEFQERQFHYWTPLVKEHLKEVIDVGKTQKFDRNYDDVIRSHIVKFGRAFRFLPLLLSSELNENHVIGAIRHDLLAPLNMPVSLGPILLQGLNDVKHVGIKIFKTKQETVEEIGYNILLKFADIRGMFDWHFRTVENTTKTSTFDFFISGLTIIAGPGLAMKSGNSTYFSTWTTDNSGVDVRYDSIKTQSINSNLSIYEEFSETVLSKILNEQLNVYFNDLLKAKKFIE